MGRLMVFRRGLSFVLTSAWANSQAHQLILNPQLDMKAFGPLWSPQENPGSFGLRLHLKPKTPNFQVKTQYVCTLHIPKTERPKKKGEGAVGGKEFRILDHVFWALLCFMDSRVLLVLKKPRINFSGWASILSQLCRNMIDTLIRTLSHSLKMGYP